MDEYETHYEKLAEELNRQWQKRKHEDRHSHPSHLVHELLEGANRKMEGFGVEGILDEENGTDIQYVNMGDSYTLTLVFDHGEEKFRISTWADELERQEWEYASKKTEKQYELNYAHKGNGLTVWNRLEEKDGDCVTVAHIAPDRTVKFYDRQMPDSVKNQIEQIARTSNARISATQDMPVFDTPPQGEKRAREKSAFDPASANFRDIEIGQRVTFQPHDRKAKLTGKVLETDENSVTLQCGRAIIPVLREKGNFAEAPETETTHTKEYAEEQARKHVGEEGNVFSAKGEGVLYLGTIVELTPTYAIQKVGEGHGPPDAVLHRLKDLGKDQSLISVGQDVSIVKGAKGAVTVEPRQSEQAQAQDRNREGVSR